MGRPSFLRRVQLPTPRRARPRPETASPLKKSGQAWRLRSWAAAAGIAVVLAGCAGTGHSSRAGGTLELAAADDIKSLDPAIAYDTAGWAVIRVIYTGLLDYDDRARLVPHGATSWTVSPDGLTYTFHLRRDMRFEGPLTHNRPVTSSDFAYEMSRCLDKKVASPGSAFFTNIVGAPEFHAGRSPVVKGLVTTDPFTLVVHLIKPDPTFLYIMALPFSYAVPREVVEKYGENAFPEHAEGSGPFVLAHWKRLVDLELDRNHHYWQPGVPKVERLHERIGLESINQTMMFEAGELDLAGIPSADFIRITRDPRFRNDTEKRVQIAIYYISLNCEMPPLNNVKVRQAINYAIDRKHLLQLINNKGVEASSVLPPAMPGFDPTMRPYPHDPAEARKLLTQAGFSHGFATTLWVRSSGGSGDEIREAQAIKQDLDGVGIKLEIKPVAFPVWESGVATEYTYPMSMNDWYQDFPDPSDFLDVLLNSKQATPKAGNNNAFYKSRAMDGLLNRAAHMMDARKRLELYNQANHLAYHDAPWVFLYYPTAYELHQPWVHGFKIPPVWPAAYEQVSVDR